MSIRYRVLPLKNPRDLTAQEKFYLRERSIGRIGREYLIKDMVRNTSLTQAEAATGIDYLFEAVPRFLELGFTVQLGRVGYFTVTLNSEGSDTVEEATVDKLKGIHLRFILGRISGMKSTVILWRSWIFDPGLSIPDGWKMVGVKS